MNQSKKVTIQDIARHANVSAGTVDRVIHNRGKVAPERKQKIEAAIKELNFNPNFLARTLALGKQFTIYSLIPEAVHPGNYWNLPQNGIAQAEKMYKDFGFVIEPKFYNLHDEDSFVKQANSILEKAPSGVIMAPLFKKASISFIKKLKEKNIPFVFIDTDIPEQGGLSYIGPDVKRSGYIAGKILNAAINRNGRYLILNMAKGRENVFSTERMENGFKDFFHKNCSNSEFQIQTLTINSIQRDEIFRELTKFYLRNGTVDAIFVTNSNAHLVSDYNTLHELNTRIVGFDLIDENIKYLKQGGIDCIISQSPKQQGVKAVQVFFDLFVYKHQANNIQYVPLDIIIPENVDYYIDFN